MEFLGDAMKYLYDMSFHKYINMYQNVLQQHEEPICMDKVLLNAVQ